MPRATAASRLHQNRQIDLYTPTVKVASHTVVTISEERRRVELTVKVTVADFSSHFLLPLELVTAFPFPHNDVVVRYPGTQLPSVDIVTPWAEVRLSKGARLRAALQRPTAGPITPKKEDVGSIPLPPPPPPVNYYTNPTPNLPQQNYYPHSPLVQPSQYLQTYQPHLDPLQHCQAELGDETVSPPGTNQ